MTQNKELNLKNDVMFQAFFARKGNEEFLIDFLNALLKIDIKQIEIREEVNLRKLSKDQKGGRLDLQAKLDNGLIVNIEMQLRNNGNIKNRTTFYSAKVLTNETEAGTRYDDIKQVIMINILDYEMLGFDEYVSETAIVLDKHRDYEVLNGIKWYFVELPKFRKAKPDMNNRLNQWLAFIDNYDKGLIELAEKKNETIERAKIEMRYLTGDAEVKRMAELKQKWEMDYNSDISYAKKEGMAEGMAKGMAKGEAKGKAEGRAEGKAEGISENKIEIAKKLLKMNMPIEQIAEITELSKEEILNIKNNNK